MAINLPLISCLCVTNDRVHLLKRSVGCFQAQSYSNKEMIIVCRENDVETLSFIESLDDSRLNLIKIPANHQFTLGELRNISIKNANGEYFCQWDDDDWYHRDRIDTQYSNVSKNLHPATMLTNIIIFDAAHSQAYFSLFRLWEPTVMAKKSLFPNIRYEPLPRSEDHEFMNRLLMESKIYPTIACNLYIYVYHGNNTCDLEHFNMLFGNAQKLSPSTSHLVMKILSGEHSVGQASELLNSHQFTNEVNYFFQRGRLLEKEREEQHA